MSVRYNKRYYLYLLEMRKRLGLSNCGGEGARSCTGFEDMIERD